MNNNNVGMHFVHYSRRSEDIYLMSNEEKKAQKEAWEHYMQLNEKEPAITIEWDKEKPINCINNMYKAVKEHKVVYYPILNATRKSHDKYWVWVSYDIGGKAGLTGEKCERGFYLYFMHKKSHTSCRKILISKVNRYSQKEYMHALEIAKRIIKPITDTYFPFLKVNLDAPVVYSELDAPVLLFVNRDAGEYLRDYRTITKCTLK